jgi:signal transduction histidine kinase
VEKTIDQLNGLPGVELTTDLDPAARALVDPEHFGSVISNLLLNARDAVSENGRVHVHVGKREDRTIISVKDNGCGMTPEFIASHLFRPFSSTKNKGLGIGMFQCKVLVEAHHGAIEIDSAPGEGTTFRVNLPALAPDGAPAK